jgi:RNA polymerase sigma factor (sigma-70 family)
VAATAIYDRYADRLHDFCWSLLRDADRAAEATERAFITAFEQLEQVRDMEPLLLWLYRVAHRQVLESARGKGNDEGVEADAVDPFAVDEESNGAADRDVEREVVWRAAAGLSGRDQALLTLHLRHRLEEAELGEALGVDADQARALVSRLSDQVGHSLGAVLVGLRGRRDCAELAKLLAESETRFAMVRQCVTRHVGRCQTCAKHLGSVDPLALLAEVPLLPAPPELRERVLGRIATTGPSASAPTTSAPAGSTTAATTSVPTSTTVAPAARLALSPEVVDLGARARTATFTVRNAGASAIRWRASRSAGWLTAAPAGGGLAPGASVQVTLTADRTGLPEGQLHATALVDVGATRRRVAVQAVVERAPSIHVTVSPTRIRTLSLCGDTMARVTAAISDESTLGGVVLEWGDPVIRMAMSHLDGTWQADIGPVDRAQTLRWRVVATDARGNTGETAGTVQVDACLVVG